MLFQTLLQLNILILATPALAGWSLLPPVHGTVHAACIVWQYRVVETPAPKAAALNGTRQATRTATLTRLFAPVPTAAVCIPAPRAVLVSLPILPHAARAP